MLEIRGLAEKLQNPPEDCYPVVMWFWNDIITESEVKRQLGEFKKKKIYEFFIHPLWGLQLRYLSERFFALIKTAIDYARENGMKFWIYDEYNWPSGTAGATIIKKHPWTKASYLSKRCFECAVGTSLSEDVGFPVVDAYFTADGETSKVRGLKRVRNGFSWENTTGKSGTLAVLYRRRHEGMTTTAYGAKYSNEEPGYLDLMNPDAVDMFLESTHELYREHFGDEFGRTLKGVFTDEPSFSIFAAPEEGIVPYTGAFFAEFKKLKGYDARPRAWQLFTPEDDESFSVFKKDWFETLSHLFEMNFAEKYRRWCQDNHIIFTGHLICEEVLSIETYQNGRYFDILKHFDRPGMDTILSKLTVSGERFNIAGYMVGGVAKFSGKQRVLCEAYSGSGWNCSLADMKKVANRLMVEGINFIMYMGAYYSMKGMRKVLPGGYPPTHNDLSPQFEYYTRFNEYLARLQYLSSESFADGKTLLLYPVTSCFAHTTAYYGYNGNMHFDYYAEGTYIKRDAILCGVINSLQQINRSFNLGFETGLETAKVRNGRLCAAGSEYEVVILPGVTDVKASTAALLREFVRQGGKLILADTASVRDVENGGKVVVSAPAEAAAALEKQDSGNSDSPRASRIFTDKNIVTLVSNETSYKLIAGLNKSLSDIYDSFGVTETVTVSGDGIISGIRRNGGLYCAFLMNDAEKASDAKLTLNGCECAAVIDAQSLKLDGMFVKGERLTVQFGGYDGKILLAGNCADIEAAVSQFVPAAAPISGKAKKLPVEIKLPYNLMRFTYRLAAADKREELLKLSPDALEKTLSAKPEEWLKPMGELGGWNDFAAADQRLYPLLDFGKPFVAYSEFETDCVPDGVELLCEKLFNTRVILNGNELSGFSQFHIFNRDDLSLNVSDYIKKGKNTLILIGECVKWGYFHTLPFVTLRGDFAVRDGILSKPAVVSEGDITSQGYPNFAGILTYTATVSGNMPAALEIEAYDTVTVRVNGKTAAELVCAPRRCDITPYLKDGENRIELVMHTKLNNIFAEPEKTGITSVGIIR